METKSLKNKKFSLNKLAESLDIKGLPWTRFELVTYHLEG